MLPVIVTSKPNNEIKADLEEVQGKGVAVVTREIMEAALSQTIALPDAESIYNQLWESVQSKQNQQNSFLGNF
ncbi:MAG: hypothetical protein KGQ58_08980 [Proteobacteria bacterium]|nr:hypothetical protein [Pseudomonadota bacterium]